MQCRIHHCSGGTASRDNGSIGSSSEFLADPMIQVHDGLDGTVVVANERVIHVEDEPEALGLFDFVKLGDELFGDIGHFCNRFVCVNDVIICNAWRQPI